MTITETKGDEIPTISFCTTCCNRLYHLRETLESNLSRLEESEISTQWLILDYGSSDGMEEWFVKNYRQPMEAGTIHLFRTDEPEFYDSSHAKNVVHRLATGGILCNLDADNYLVEGVIETIARRFQNNSQCVLFGWRAARGRVALGANHFERVGGYDESLEGWGHDDTDITRRVCAACDCAPIRLKGFDKFIRHGHAERVAHMENQDIEFTRHQNLQRSIDNVAEGKFVANIGRVWGASRVYYNYDRDHSFRIPEDLSILKERVRERTEQAQRIRQHGEIYTAGYFQKLDRRSSAGMRVIADSILTAFRPNHVVDVGCGSGVLLRELKSQGVDVRGLELATSAIETCERQGLTVARWDLTQVFHTQRFSADVVICLEVAEQLPESSSTQLITSLVSMGPNVVFSAATPGQGGRDHQNEQPHEYWIKKFVDMDYTLDTQKTSRWRRKWKAAGIPNWYHRNVMVFHKGQPRPT